MRSLRNKRRTHGRLPSLGQDHDAGHRQYVEAIGNQSWLRTKPFSDPPNYELGRCLHSFAHVVEALHLGPGARVLDIGCGPGWLSEFLARCGYHVTGVDVSEDMIAIARKRLDGVRASLAGVAELHAEFAAMPVRQLPWTDQFDAVVIYDALHHFDEELETLKAIRATLIPGGRLYVHEGIRPKPGSAGERELLEEMRRYGTLESPFDPEYLLEVVAKAGFADVQRLVELDRLVPARGIVAELVGVWRLLREPISNTVVAVNPRGDGGATPAATLSAALELRGTDRRDGRIVFHVRARNTGTREWPAATTAPPSRGTVTVAPFVEEGRARRELGRLNLPWTVAPEASVELDVEIPEAEVADAREVLVDLVAEGVAWFGDLGTSTLRMPVPR